MHPSVITTANLLHGRTTSTLNSRLAALIILAGTITSAWVSSLQLVISGLYRGTLGNVFKNAIHPKVANAPVLSQEPGFNCMPLPKHAVLLT